MKISRLCILAWIILAGGFAPASFAETQKLRLYVAPIVDGADPVKAELKEALRARIEEGLAATKVFAIETRLENEAQAIVDERAYVKRAQSKSIDLIIFPVVDSLSCSREARPITAMPGKYNLKSKCSSIMRVRVISPASDELRMSFELDETEEKSLGVVDQRELASTASQFAFPENDYGNALRFSVSMDSQSRDFVELARRTSAALANRVYEDAYPPEIIEVIGDQVYISRGERGGFKVGDVVNVFARTGRILYHPVTREKIGEAAVGLGAVKITESYDDYSVGKAESVTSVLEVGSVVRR